MAIVENVLTERRSVRSYKKDQINDNELNAVLEAGLHAPSGRNRQCTIMVACQNAEEIALMSRLNASAMGVDTDPFYGAPTVVVVFADTEVYTHVEDGSLVLGNMLNAAHAIGVGSCWIHRAREVFESPYGIALKKKLGIDDKYVAVGNCILGYPEIIPEVRPRKDGYIIKA
mgnify:CR=1 FL=1